MMSVAAQYKDYNKNTSFLMPVKERYELAKHRSLAQLYPEQPGEQMPRHLARWVDVDDAARAHVAAY